MFHISKENNIGWLRLIFASLIMLTHGMHIFWGISNYYLDYFPGVPIFYFISGFLIYHSYDKSRNIKAFYLRRIEKLLPLVALVTIFTFSIMLYANGLDFLKKMQQKSLFGFYLN